MIAPPNGYQLTTHWFLLRNIYRRSNSEERSVVRERLVIIIAAQTHQQGLAQAQVEVEERRKSDAQPPPIVFPRSVSPYIYRRSTSDLSWEHHHPFDQHFYSTPQLGPTSYHTTIVGSVHKKKQSKFSLFASLFGKFRSQEPESESTDPRASRGSRSPKWNRELNQEKKNQEEQHKSSSSPTNSYPIVYQYRSKAFVTVMLSGGKKMKYRNNI
ncbi:hypothetical protein NE237_023274 [Protea cynaroides]|uniref:Uncharacterized protein n=1 Tax=Protea cynaroides TaxID=273540 RepID=A0A9Q0K610_9MAGN|nr:hypothetical protein NE237_023274 [Protea cynaroides]